VLVGLTAAYSRGFLDDVLMRAMDVILAFPSIVLALVAVATVGPKLWLIVLAVAITTMPRVARITRGAAAEIVEADLRDAAAVRALAEAAGPVDILVNNAARPSNVDIAVLPLADWEETFAVNVTAPMLLAQALGAGMVQRGWGRIVNVTSVTARMGGPSGPAYVASKAALIGLTRSLARAFGPGGVTVNALSPGAVRTEGEVELAGGRTDGLHADIVAAQAVPRPLLPADLVETVRLLVSPGAAALTGQVIEVGGGVVFR
jgi:NAD(P)-dependent dehydrogenase (short-subunit alcohol dehydrogenase family)